MPKHTIVASTCFDVERSCFDTTKNAVKVKLLEELLRSSLKHACDCFTARTGIDPAPGTACLQFWAKSCDQLVLASHDHYVDIVFCIMCLVFLSVACIA